MGQNASASRFKIQPTALIPLIGAKEGNGQSEEVGPEPSDCTSDLPDECLALIFESLGPNDRRQCSLVCRRWLRIEGQSHHRLSLNANSGLLPSIPSLFERFDAVTRLTLTCDRRSTSIGDDALVTISVSCSNLRRVKLLACRNLTHRGMEAFAKNCRGLKKFSCSQCPGVVGDSLRTIFLKELYNGPSFYPLIIGSKNLRTLRLMKCSGDWDRMLQAMTERVPGMVGIHLERIQVSDLGLNAISSCPSLEIFLMKTPYCTNLGLASVAEHCRLLRKLSIDGCRANSIGDQGLLSVATYCHNLQELVLVGVNATSLSLGSIASNCPNLERLALCASSSTVLYYQARTAHPRAPPLSVEAQASTIHSDDAFSVIFELFLNSCMSFSLSTPLKLSTVTVPLPSSCALFVVVLFFPLVIGHRSLKPQIVKGLIERNISSTPSFRLLSSSSAAHDSASRFQAAPQRFRLDQNKAPGEVLTSHTWLPLCGLRNLMILG
ncbi:hypothetical protein CRG98_031584 [Punica granatum]|uniref:F-box domain-containing protein n=1 Tax=Punica granatum TaxID=22663 RepID=A0A2I0IVP5_PUNGR|nr:hypothetical protein CRG98_031584 [Punica granatum]